MQKGIGHNPKLCIINIVEEILFQGSCLRLLQSMWHCGCSVTDHCILVPSWSPELYSGRLLNCPSAQPHPWSHWLNLREGGKCKKAASLYIGWQEGEASLRSTAQAESRAGIPFTCSVWSCKLVRESFARARLGFHTYHVTSCLPGLQKRCRRASVAVMWQGIHICRYPCD